MRQFDKIKLGICFTVSFCALACLAGPANADIISKASSAAESSDYWTPERLRNAKPFPIPMANPNAIKEIESATGTSDSGDGAEPNELASPMLNNFLYTPTAEHKLSHTLDQGTLRQPYSSSRLVPLTADLTYPYRAVGKLFFTQPGVGNFVCSASVVRHRIVVTAGHCVHRGSGGSTGFFTNFLFIPAFRDGAAPFQSWRYRYVATTSTWANGGGGVPNAADYAMLEMEDHVIGDAVRKISWLTGYFGYQTLSLNPNHAHLLGYPCNLDSCQKMHQVTAQSARSVSPNNVEYGSDMRGGSSGGPWVQNFGAYAVGQTGGTNSGINRIVGITSYLYTDIALKSEGSSLPDSRFTSLLNFVCAHRAGNCND